MTTVSKPIMTIANKIVDITAPSLKIREEREQTQLEEFIAKISLILHNLFTKGEFNIDLNDVSVNKVVLEIAKEVKFMINNYQNDSITESPIVTVPEFPSVQIKFEIDKDNKLNVTLIESDEVYYFPKEETLLSIDLKDQKEIQHNLKAMDKVRLGRLYSVYQFANIQITPQYKMRDLLKQDSLVNIYIPYAKEYLNELNTVRSQYDMKSLEFGDLEQNGMSIDLITFLQGFYFSQLTLDIKNKFKGINNDPIFSQLMAYFDPIRDLEMMKLCFGGDIVKDSESCGNTYANLVHISGYLS